MDLYVLQQSIKGRLKKFQNFVDEIICTGSGDPDECLTFAILLQINFQFTVEKVNMERDLASLDISVNASMKKNNLSMVSKTN